ncbi:hypothetical protein HPB52_013545 [Rhipicephalus sanguineus]|uniref:Uncharacterized protein n=1 Tax=Rhipicephalus sanguineus TaxID=34632 RepID=A0A9D4PFI4_RHISA|nr:hypothetical protein HPB52_013545 [Rhipicephalus sanguineus]
MRLRSSEETCWLCDNRTAWNRMMSVLDLALDEWKPGLLLLWCSFDRKAGSERVTAVRAASFLASWLLCHHSYVEDGFLSCRTSISTPVEEPPSHIHLHPLSSTATSRWLRGMNINNTYSAILSLRHLDAFNGLEMIYIHADEINQDFHAQIDELVAHNRTTLNKVDILEFQKTRNGHTKVEKPRRLRVSFAEVVHNGR